MLLIFIIIFLISFIWALFSMRDFQIPKEIEKMISSKKIKGKIIFLKNKILFYKSYSSSSSS